MRKDKVCAPNVGRYCDDLGNTACVESMLKGILWEMNDMKRCEQ